MRKNHSPPHPYRQELLYDPDYFFRWHPEKWPERDRAALHRATGADIADLRAEIDGLRDAFARLAAAVKGGRA